ncbi:tyrosine-type recombinase/integrase [uncultured Dysgonomonas sp.]|uniref:Putative Site-specific recombinase XerD n=1 Tax=uncultured Dysgonomonas sp. TaxID=206096 RepID=A0A212K1X5_9BACT|nr:tyrosine-type recombinase/integrase [uncultured Dysgonomonas sp.]SBW05642.1 putative Site-specific recombinase XerD [uncultured Dysgonomonas sp.]
MDINFFLKDKSKKTSSIRAIVRFKGQRYPIYVGETVIVKYWNTSTHRCRIVREYPDASFINKRLEEWADIIEMVFNEWGMLVPTQLMVKDAINEKIRQKNIDAGGISDKEDEQYLINFAHKYRNECQRKEETKKSYLTTINKLLAFEKKYKVRLRFIDINIDFYNRFMNWMLTSTYKKGDKQVYYTKNYIGGLIKDIKTFTGQAKKQKLHNFSFHEDEDFKTEQENTDSIYLTEEEIVNIYNLKFTEEFLINNGYDARPNNLKSAIKSLNEERDRFLIGCFTALRHSDYSRLENANFKDDLIGIWTLKKDKRVFVPMHHLLKEILERRSNILPKPISGQKHNKQIKEIGKLAGINDEVLLTKTRGGKRVSTVGSKYEFITTHTARRSGATNMYLAGIDIKFIQDLLGHSKVEQTLNYIKVSAEENAKRLMNHTYFKGEEKK